MNVPSLYRTATYWPPGSWESGEQNIGLQIQALWTIEGDEERVHLLTDVAEGGYLLDGVASVPDPRVFVECKLITKYYTYPDLRSLKQVRIAIVE